MRCTDKYTPYYKAALAVDAEDYPEIAGDIKAISEISSIDLTRTKETIDNTYICLYWDVVPWDMPETKPLLEKLEHMRHALITVSEEGEVWKDVAISDKRGCDEEFYEILDLDATICFWDEDMPLAPEKDFVPIGRARLIQLLKSYIGNDYDGMCETFTLYEAMEDAGFSDEEIESLGFGFCIPEDMDEEEVSA